MAGYEGSTTDLGSIPATSIILIIASQNTTFTTGNEGETKKKKD